MYTTYSIIVSVCLIGLISAGTILEYQKVTNPSSSARIEVSPIMPVEKNGNTNYYFGPVYVGNFFQAIQFCNYHSMSLLSIETKEENDFLFKSLLNFLGDGGYTFWASGTILPENHWIWLSTGKPIVYTNWIPGQPDNVKKNEQCLEVRYTKSSKALLWADTTCTNGRHVICETLVPRSVSELIATSSNCNLTLINVPIV